MAHAVMAGARAAARVSTRVLPGLRSSRVPCGTLKNTVSRLTRHRLHSLRSKVSGIAGWSGCSSAVAQVRADFREKIENILALLDSVNGPEEMDLRAFACIR